MSINNLGDINLQGAATSTAGGFIAPPPAIDITQKHIVDLYKVAYYRSDPPYDELLAALLAKVADLKEQLRTMK